MAKLYPEYRDRVRERIMEAAYELYLEKGYEGMKMNEIAERLGVSKPAIYQYFRGKEALFAAVAEHEKMVRMDLLADSFEGRDFMAGCETLFDTSVQFISSYSGQYADVLLLSTRNERIRAILKETQSKGITTFEAFVRRLQADGQLPAAIDPREFAIALDSFLGGLVLSAIVGMDMAEAKRIWLEGVRRWVQSY
jgi:AcrR family transcriptional regulator